MGDTGTVNTAHIVESIMTKVMSSKPLLMFLLFLLCTAMVSSLPVQQEDTLYSEISGEPDLTKVREKRFVTDIGSLLAIQLFGTAIRPLNFIAVRLNLSVAEE